MKESKTETVSVQTFMLDAKLPWEVARLMEVAARYVRANQVHVRTLHLEFDSEYGIWSLSVMGKEDCWGKLKAKAEVEVE